MVVDVEVRREAGAGELRLVPASRRAAGSRTSQRTPRSHRRRALAGGVQRQQRPRGLRRGARPRARSTPDRRTSGSPRPSRRRRSGARSSQATARRIASGRRRDPGGDQGRHGGAGPVHVVDAPAPEPRAVGLLGVAAATDPALRARLLALARARRASRPTWAVTSAVGGSITSPKSQNGRSRISAPAVVGVERRPSRRRELCIPTEPARRRGRSPAGRRRRRDASTARSASTTSAVSSMSG